jgi:MOSC domain protein
MVLYELAVGTHLQVGDDVILEITQIGKECHQGCEIMKQVGSCIMPTQGIFGKVLKNGTIRVGDEVSIIK